MEGIYFKEGENRKALEHLKKDLQLLEEVNDLHGKANCLNGTDLD